MKKILLITAATLVSLQANSLYDAFKSAKVDGYIRYGYQMERDQGGKNYYNSALGGKLSLQTGAVKGISGKVSFYTTNEVGKHDGVGLSPFVFFDGQRKSYSILGEAYIQGIFKNTTVKVGRQEIDTPFINADDIGMIPNTYEAGVLINKDIKDTTIMLAQVQKMAGVEGVSPRFFRKISQDNIHTDNIQILGITYEGVKNLVLNGWYYNLQTKKDGDLKNISYLEAVFGSSIKSIDYSLGLQYANQSHQNSSSTNIVGTILSIGLSNLGLTLSGAYNKANNSADNIRMGPPFFTNTEVLILPDAGKNGKTLNLGFEWDATTVGAKGLSLSYHNLQLRGENVKSHEFDYSASYLMNSKLSLDIIYVDVYDTNGGNYYNDTRVFVNYSF